MNLAAALFAVTVPIVNAIYPNQETGTPWSAINAAPVTAGASVYSNAFDLFHAKHFQIEAWCSGANPDVQVDWFGATTNNEGDFAFITSIAPVGAATPRFVQFAPTPTRYGRIRVTGNAATLPDTICTVKLFLTSPLDP